MSSSGCLHHMLLGHGSPDATGAPEGGRTGNGGAVTRRRAPGPSCPPAAGDGCRAMPGLPAGAADPVPRTGRGHGPRAVPRGCAGEASTPRAGVVRRRRASRPRRGRVTPWGHRYRVRWSGPSRPSPTRPKQAGRRGGRGCGPTRPRPAPHPDRPLRRGRVGSGRGGTRGRDGDAGRRQPASVRRSTRNGPIARASRLPCRNDRTASSGVQTMGSSCMLNEVLMIVGVPVRRL